MAAPGVALQLLVGVACRTCVGDNPAAHTPHSPAHTRSLARAQVIVVNGEPFPNIFVNVADRVIVKVTNRLQDPLSIHWHGIRQVRRICGV
jgi:FtsP/CotA-like multicopper oxidase with cupredoxin domain